jgi:hypothetical protein
MDLRLFRRMAWIQAALVVTGLIGWGLARGRIGLLSFGAGATVASLGFWVLYRIAAAMMGARPGVLATFLMTSRLLVAGVVLYVILRTYEVLPAAIVLGVLTPVLAILLATLYDFFYARTS